MDLSNATREIYWNIDGVWAMYALFVVAIVICGHGVYRRVAFWRQGKPDQERFSDWGRRLVILVRELVLQGRVRGSAFPGVFHSFIFYAFLVLVVTTATVFIDADFHLHIFRGWVYVLLSFGSELGGLFVLLGAGLALYRRLVIRPKTLETCAADKIALAFLFTLVLTGFLTEALRVAGAGDRWPWISFVGWGLSFAFQGMDEGTLRGIHKGLWWGHTVVAMGWIATLPYTKFFHLLALPTNVFLSKLKPRGELNRVDMEALMSREDATEEDLELGVAKVQDFTWKQRFDFDACVSCGRCDEVCPATRSGHPFAPKTLIQQNLMLARKVAQGAQGGQEAPSGEIVGTALDEDFVWHCRTCGACMEVCPAAIDHVDILMEIRRNEILMQGRVPQEGAKALRQLENLGNPFGGSDIRTEFIEANHLPVVGPGESVDVLYWIGCCTTFDPAKQKIATDLVEILDRCGVTYGVLGDDERCCGDPARLFGEERLFQEIAKAQAEVLNSRNFKILLVNCPHCFNVLANEYPQFGGRYKVVHHSELLQELISQGKIQPEQRAGGRVVYHDPCYLGRYQKVYDAPRQVLQTIAGSSRAEMGEDIRERSLCCGGGGGHYWMDLKASKERINNLRVDQAQAEKADTLVTSCPYCLQMLEDAVKARDLDETLRVVDLASLLRDRLPAKADEGAAGKAPRP